jgi:hypothetical protein
MISFDTPNPNGLLASFKEAIRKGHVETWSDVNGDFTHTPPQWKGKAWMRPTVYANELRFSIIRPQNGSITSEIYAVYHGRFIETMLAHFDKQFSTGAATALASQSDRIAA